MRTKKWKINASKNIVYPIWLEDNFYFLEELSTDGFWFDKTKVEVFDTKQEALLKLIDNNKKAVLKAKNNLANWKKRHDFARKKLREYVKSEEAKLLESVIELSNKNDES